MKQQNVSNERQMGFTLIELMMVIVIAAILLSLAIPAYNDSVRKTRRNDAKATMLSIAQGLERCFTVNSTYDGCFVGNNLPGSLATTPPNASGAGVYYNLSYIGGGTTLSTWYTVLSVPANDQANDSCGTLSLTSTGDKRPMTNGCW